MIVPPLPPRLPPLPPREDLQAVAICTNTIRLDLYGEVHEGRVCTFVSKTELLAIAKQLTQIALQV